jgi:hypothetical protein
MRNKALTTIALVLTITACGGTSQPQLAKAPTNHSVSVSAPEISFIYDPQGREEFVFDEVPEILQQYAYKDICFSVPERGSYECSGHQLAYDKYFGKRGFYTDRAPIRKGDSILREAVLETGEMIYTVSSTKYSHVGKDRLPMEMFLKRKNFVSYPIVAGAEAIVTGYSKTRKESLTVSTNEDSSYTLNEVKAIQKIASQHPRNGAEMADLMTTLHVKYDEFEGRTTISGYPFNNKDSYLSLRLVIKDDGTIIPFVAAYYKADDWLFVESYSVKADEFKWRSGSLKFERDHTSGTIWEWNNTVLTEELNNMLNEIAAADTATVRFHGRYYDDHSVTPKQQEELSSLLRLLELSK